MIKKVDYQIITIGEAYDIFSQEKELQYGTKDKYRRELIYFLKDTNISEEDKVNDITQSMVNDYIIHMRDKHYATATINHNIVSLRVFLYWCMTQDYLTKFTIKTVKGQDAKLKYCTDEEVKKLLEKPNRDDYVEHRTHTIISFLLGTGCRLKTLINLKKEDVDFRSKSITYRHLKNKKVATIPMSPQLEKILIDFLRRWDTGTDWLFCTSNSEQLKSETVQQSMDRYCKARGLRRINPHECRHTYARLWILNGGNAFILQHMLTHSSIETTQRYVKIFSQDISNTDYQKFVALDNILNTNSKRRTVICMK